MSRLSRKDALEAIKSARALSDPDETMTDEQQEALETMRSGFGLCVGQLREDEMKAFNFLCKEGLAKRSYRGAMGLLGLAIAERDQPPQAETA